MHSHRLLVVVSAVLAVGYALAFSLVGCSVRDGDAPAGSEERARQVVELGLLHAPHGKNPKLTFCEDACIACAVRGCAEVAADCDDPDSDGHAVCCGYVFACDRAKQLACGTIDLVKSCMGMCP